MSVDYKSDIELEKHIYFYTDGASSQCLDD